MIASRFLRRRNFDAELGSQADAKFDPANKVL
jgi:hypothetical protein